MRPKRLAIGAGNNPMELSRMKTLNTVLSSAPQDGADVETMRVWRKAGLESGATVYPLSPLQEGMLFHSLSASHPGVDITQLICDWREEIDGAVFSQSWQQLIERHPIFRTSFDWDGPESPRQRVHERVRLPVRQKDWRGLSRQGQEERLQELLRADRLTNFDLGVPPLMRVTLIRLGQARCQFVLTIHHLLVDGRTVVILMNDLFELYRSLQSGEAPRLRPAPAYREYIDWLQRQDWSDAESFWRRRLEGFATATPLSVSVRGSRGPVQEGNWAEEETVVTEKSIRILRELAKGNGLTLNTLLQGAWSVVLSRYSGEEDVVFGAVRAGRHLPVSGTKDIAGPLINTLPVRVRCAADMELIPWLKSIREQWKEMRPFEHSPLAKVQAWSRVPPGQPLFHTILNVLDPPWDAVLRKSWSGRDFRVRNHPNYPLALDVYVDASARLTLVYDTELLPQPAVRRMLASMRTVLEAMADAPGRRVGDLPVLSEAEQFELLEKWNDTARSYPDADCVHRLFEAQARRSPEALAVAGGGVQFNYRQLDELAHRVVCRLRNLGVEPGTRVGICVERSVENVAGLLGILKAGAAFVPLDPEYPRDRLAFMISDANIQVLLTQRKWLPRLPDVDARVLCLDDLESGTSMAGDPSSPPDRDEAAPPDRTTAGSLAYVIYTSGSTGTPKGVEIEHQGVVNLIRWHQEQYQVRPEDRATQLASLSFDASVWELWPYLTAGASVHIPDEPIRMNPDKLVQWMAEQRITITFLPTPLAEAIMDGPWPEGTALRALLTGGDRLHRAPRENLPFQLVNHYGPTENSVVSTAAVIQPARDAGEAPPIGRPIANTRLYILDQRLRLVPVGVPGELYVAGAGLARGYLNRPELTADRFIANPFRDAPFRRMYRTGDLVRYREDGNVEFLGRIDQQVKLRGYRIELGEIEAALSAQSAVREAVVVAHEDGETRLVAYVVAERNHAPSAEELRSCLQETLPGHMVPSTFVFLDQLPLTPNGKVDRKALPAPELRPPEICFVAPRNSMEEELAGIWCDLLRLKQVGVRDNFFEMGGHSLMATQVISRVRNAFGVELPRQAVFEDPTVEEFAERLGKAMGEHSAIRPVSRMSEDGGDGEVALSFGQERLWFLDQLEPGLAVYNVPVGFVLRGDLDIAALERSLNALAARHECLRTSFGDAQGRPKALRAGRVRLGLPVVELGGLPGGEQQAEMERVMAEEAARPFDLRQAPLLRTKLLRLGGRKHVLILTTHHIVSDGWTMAILYRELRELYEAGTTGRSVSLPELPLAFGDYARWQREWLSGEVLDRQLSFWKQRLQGPLPALELPVDHPRPARQSFRGGLERVTLGGSLFRDLKSLGRREDVTLFMLLLAAFQTLLHRYSGQDEIITGTTVAGRTRSEFEGLAGLFLNTLALRTVLSGDVTFRELLRRVRRTALECYEHQDVPFEKVVEAAGVERDLGRSPVFQAMFVLQKAPLPPARSSDLEWSSLQVHNGTSKFDLTLSLEEEAKGLSGYLEYNRDLFEPETMARISGHFRTLLEGVVANPDRKLGELPLLTGIERRRLLVECNRTDADYRRDSRIHELFEEQVARAPDAVAVVFEENPITYAELNLRAGRLAERLRDLGVGPDTRAGICVNRSIEMLVGLLGILKTGGCYLPLDPAYPKERLAFMLEDSQASVLLTQQALRDHFNFEIPNLKQVCVDTLLNATRPVPSGQHASNAGTLDGINPAPRLQFKNRKSEIGNQESTDPAYLIYTSGSTGKPKGVIVPHRAVVNFLTSMAREPGLKADDVLVAVTTLSFDIAVLELLLPLTVGARVVIANQDEVVDGRALGDLLERHQATVMQATPVTWRLLLEAGWNPRRGFKVLVGGEALPADLADRLLACGVELWNMYGPTETTVWSTCARISDIANGITIGRPIANTSVRILDKSMHLCPVGVSGELCIGGDGVALGYWNRPELTADRFISDPYSTVPGARLYRTGDLARWRGDGTIEHQGRLDFQVKLRGFRIELGEIETAMARHPAVREAVVSVREDNSTDKRLVAYLVADNAPGDLVDQLRARLRAAMPEYMVPSQFVMLEALPRTHNGKLDRRALPPPGDGDGSPRGVAAAPRTPTEAMILGLFHSVLDRADFGVSDSFFDLGGHSLMAARLMSRLRAESGVDLPLRDLFARPTVAGLAEAIDALQWLRTSRTPANNDAAREDFVL